MAVALALGISPKAKPYFQRGFPQDGQPLLSEPRVPVAGDARLVTPVQQALLQFTRLSPSAPGVVSSLAEVTRTVKVPISDDIIRAVLRLQREGQAEVARNLFTQADADRIRTCALQHESWTQEAGVLARVLDALGAGSDDDAESILVGLSHDVPAKWQPDMNEAENERHIANAQRTLLAMGARGGKAALKHVGDDHPEVRKVCLEVAFQNVRPHFMGAVLSACEKFTQKEFERALDLAKDDPQLLDLQLRAIVHPWLVEKVQPALLRLKPTELVPALFNHIALRSSFSPDEVTAYRHLLDAISDSAAPTAQVLDEALTRAGRPEGVYWLTKMLALEHLGNVGSGPAQRAVVEKFLADTSNYQYVSIRYKPDTGKEISRSPTTIYFATTAKNALEHMH